MLNVTIRLIEFMDSLPLDDCPVVVTARVAPLFEVPFLPPGLVNSPSPAIQPADQPGGGGDPLTVFRPNFSKAINFRQEQQSNANGVAGFRFELKDAFTRVTKDNPNAADVKVYLLIEVNCAGMRREISLIAFPLTQDDDFDTFIPFDFAKTIVGHVTGGAARLWLQYHGELSPSQTFTVQLSQAGDLVRSRNVRFNNAREQTALLEIDDLQPGAHYTYQLIIRDPADNTIPTERVIAQGAFETAFTSNAIEFVFGSCHKPVEGNDFGFSDALGRWQVLSNRKDYDFMILLGDQIYGDNIEEYFPNSSWRERYVNRYNQLWQYQPMRKVLRRTPTYMILDDHDVVDDFGTAVTRESHPERVSAALEVYKIYQDALNPPRAASNQLHYSFRRGPAAFFVMDQRTRRGFESGSPILGQAQLRDLRAWANAPETRAADVIFLVSSVPITSLPIPQIQHLVNAIEPGAIGIGGLLGAGAGLVLFGPAGAEIGYVVGATATAIIYEQKEDAAPIEQDIADQWNFEDNQKDLEAVLDILFDLANDITNGLPGPRPRAVFILAGDMHLGASHIIRSTRTGSGHDHRRNPLVYQFLSSGISHPPSSDWAKGLKVLDVAGFQIDPLRDVSQARLVKGVSTMNEVTNPFILDPDMDQAYQAEFLNLLIERNFGRIAIERMGDGRRYRFHAAIEGERSGLVQLFELDLDKQTILPESLIGQVLAAQGRLTLLRVNDICGKFGPQGDQIDAEVIVQLDNEPQRAFGFQLRADGNEAVHRKMLDLLRDAFNRNRPVRLEYVRTGLRNGRIIRTTDLV